MKPHDRSPVRTSSLAVCSSTREVVLALRPFLRDCLRLRATQIFQSQSGWPAVRRFSNYHSRYMLFETLNNACYKSFWRNCQFLCIRVQGTVHGPSRVSTWRTSVNGHSEQLGEFRRRDDVARMHVSVVDTITPD